MNLTLQDKRKELFLNRLNEKHPGWKDGDQNNQKYYSADLVNDSLRVAIELKQDTITTFPQGKWATNLKSISNRYKNHAKSANKKFRNYPNYKTILIIEGNINRNLAQSVFCGIQIINPHKTLSKFENIYLSQNTENIGVYLVNSWKPNNSAYYLKNPNANKSKIMLMNEINDLFPLGFSLTELY